MITSGRRSIMNPRKEFFHSLGSSRNKGAGKFLAGILIAASMFTIPAAGEPRHGLSAFGDLKYKQDFSHFDYVNPDAPKGGTLTTLGTEGRVTFDSLNGYILKGEPAQKLDLLFDTLMVRANDEADAVYGLVAKWADLADDKMSVTFGLRERARFADGTPLTSVDVAESFKLIREKGHERIKITIRDVAGVDIIDKHTIRYRFKGKNIRDLPLIVATLPIFSKAYYQKHDFAKTTLTPPLGSGPYRIANLKQGQHVTYELRRDYWAKALPVNRGRYNFSVIKLLYFRDRTSELEALKAGALDLREEFTSKSWATEYELQSVKDGRLIKTTISDDTASGAQGFFINMRRKKFADIRTRQALDLAFDFEWTNQNLFFNLYQRTTSFFENSAMKATGKPGPKELEIIKSLGEKNLPEFTQEVYTPPVSDRSGQDRKLLRRASQLLQAAGWVRKGTGLVDKAGKPLTVEFLIYSPSFERIISPFVRNLKLLGVDASIRFVEAAQYQERLKRFDFDILTQRYTVNQTPGVELRAFFGSKAADIDGSYNLSGIRSELVDKIIDKMIQAETRDELNITARILDRVLRAKNMWVPHWYKSAHNIAHWNMFGWPKIKPRFDRGVFDTWWIDRAKFEKLKKGP